MGSWTGNWTAILLITTLMFVGSIVVVGILIVRMPTDYLTRDHHPESRFVSQRPFLRGVVWFLKNTCGLVILIAGIVMLITPGQGVLFIFLGLSLLDFPGRRKLLRRLLGRHGVLKMINQLRRNANQPPLEYPGQSL
jgi:hypothetical protein